MALGPDETLTGAKVVKENLQAQIDSGAGSGGISPNIVNAKGDLIVGTADNSVSSMSAGTGGQVLSVDSSASTGLRWITLSAGSSEVTSVNSRTGDVVLTKTDVGLQNVDNTSDANKPISTAVQAGLDGKAAVSHNHTAANITDFAEAVDDRVASLIVAGTNMSVTYNDATNQLTLASSASGGASDAASITFVPTGNIAATDVQTALAELDSEKASAANLSSHTSNTSNPHSVTKAQVGLGNVDNTSDANKPVSTAVQTALDLKASITSVLVLGPASEQSVTLNTSYAWYKAYVPYSNNDSNADQTVWYAGHSSGSGWVKVAWRNGNNEYRFAPSRADRVGFRAFEYAESSGGPSTENFAEFSTNPINASNREALLALRGTGASELPGWVILSRGIDSPNVKPGEWTDFDSFGGGATASGSTYEAPASRLEPNGSTSGGGRISLRGRIDIPSGVSAGTALFTLASAHRPAKTRGFAVRTGPGGNLATIMTIDSSGNASLIVSSGGSASYLYLDDISFAL